MSQAQGAVTRETVMPEADFDQVLRDLSQPRSLTLNVPPHDNAVLGLPFATQAVRGMLVANLHHYDSGHLFSGTDPIVVTNLGRQALRLSLAEAHAPDTQPNPTQRMLPPLHSTLVRPGVTLSTADASATGLVALTRIDVNNRALAADGATRIIIRNDARLMPLPAPFDGQHQTLCLTLRGMAKGDSTAIDLQHKEAPLHLLTQLTGSARLQKFDGQSLTPFEEQPLTPGLSHTPVADALPAPHAPRFVYPPLRYQADSASLWLTFDYLPNRETVA